MSVHYVTGDLLQADVQYICHQVNCQGRMASGIAKQIREKWPDVYTSYMDWYNYHHERGGERNLHGEAQFITVADNKTVINMFAQLFYGYDGKRYTSYDAFWSCLGNITQTVPKGSTIGFPWRIGCGLGGANWEVIVTMIEQVLGTDYEVYIYMLEE
jgi:O-acetyl-ADP-ribose deacetylase (regulator of RNase III)